MEILYFMVPLGLVLVAFGLWAFFWAVGSGQFDDLDSPGWTVLDDEKSRDKPAAARDSASESGSDAASGPAVTDEDQK
jgi:cbb3-type cytochrome oxidase maturation protein